jgi:cytochrome P450
VVETSGQRLVPDPGGAGRAPRRTGRRDAGRPALAERDDVLAMLVRDAEGLSDQDLREELVTLVTAGHETTAMAIAWGCELLGTTRRRGATPTTPRTSTA